MSSPRYLAEHFFRALFDFGFLSEVGADSFKRVLVASVGGCISLGLLLTRVFMVKYASLMGVTSPEPYRLALLGDDLFLIGLPMLLVAFVTLLVSHSLFPDERDFRILGPLPVHKSVVFNAKLSALFLFASLFTAAAHVALVPLMLLTSVNRWSEHTVLARVTTWAIASVSASAFAVLAITATIGLLVLGVSRGRLQTLTALMRSGVIAVLVLCVPLVSQLPTLGSALSRGSTWLAFVPPAWFLGLERVLLGSTDPWLVTLAGIAVGAIGAAVVIVAATYTLLFRQFERLMLRAAPTSAPWFSGERGGHLPWRAVAAERRRRQVAQRNRAAHPAFRAVSGFVLLTIGRSQLHQGVLVGLSACGVGLAMNSLIGGNLARAALWTPFVLMFAWGVGVRAALALPMEYRANWIFQLTEDRATRREQFRAVDRLVTLFVAGVPAVTAAPFLWLALGARAAIAVIVVALIGLVFVHVVLFDWHRIPFTCSYLPGKRFIGHSSVFGLAACVFFTVFGWALVGGATSGTRPALIIVVVLASAAYLLRRRRLIIWGETPLMFEDEFPDQMQQLHLQG
ncbi:MAG TPA: hypothetical protein VI485_17460 [Vicinamibacterales bacterium]|nr:hypothetical protein [Vicinamibacterales bacterium]